MEYIWNIYEPLEPQDLAVEDPFDVFVYSQRMDEPPHLGDCVFVEGRQCKVIACQVDRNMNDVQVQDNVLYYKVCVS